MNAIVPNRGSELLLMVYYVIKCVFVCVSLTFLMIVTDTLQAESCLSHFCLPSAFFRAFAVFCSILKAECLFYKALETNKTVQKQKYKSEESNIMPLSPALSLLNNLLSNVHFQKLNMLLLVTALNNAKQ